ncbi:MAG: hypothetical protein H6907_09675 [Hyphomicrobiales bacterium]|nr:hypothetical protein [Hyphomicrobiales bacterium]MCP5371988.1 hypothetical protein [Hyphomicrobiales bacterium]
MTGLLSSLARRRRLPTAWGPAAALVLLAAAAVAAAPLQATDPNRSDCMCRYFGHYYAQGDVVCMRGPAGRRLARCEMMLNNPSWRVTATPCPGV